MGAKQPNPEPRRTYIQPGEIEFGRASFRQRYESNVFRGANVLASLFVLVIGFPFAALGWLFPENPRTIEFIYIPAEKKPVSPPAPPSNLAPEGRQT